MPHHKKSSGKVEVDSKGSMIPPAASGILENPRGVLDNAIDVADNWKSKRLSDAHIGY